MHSKLSRSSIISAVVGGGAWLLLLPFSLSDSLEGDLIQRVLLLGVLVIVPLGLALITSLSESRSQLIAVAAQAQPFAAWAVIISAFRPPGLIATGLSALWLIITGLIGLEGFLRLFGLRKFDVPVVANISVIAGMVYLPVGAVWLIMSRLGIQFLGFGDTIVLLTAVHFHFAGFAAPLLVGLTGYQLRNSTVVQTLLVFVTICVIAGTPLVAAGITVSPIVALLGAIVISLGLFGLALLNFVWIIPNITSWLPRLLLIISSIACLPAMALAGVYAYSIVFQKLIVDIPQMTMTHGLLNAFGFSLCGLAAWVLMVKREQGFQDREIC